MTTTALRSLKLDDVLALEVDELNRMIALFDTALARKQSPSSSLSSKIQQLELQLNKVQAERLAELEFKPKIDEHFGAQPVKLNVGGTHFAISLEHLTKEPNTYFSILFGGKWNPKTDPKDGSVFIDRDPTMFGLILDFLRTGELCNLDKLSKEEMDLLRAEADFYQVSSLIDVLPYNSFHSQVRGQVKLDAFGSLAVVQQSGSYSAVISEDCFSSELLEMTIRMVKGCNIMIGVAPKEILNAGQDHDSCGWHLHTSNGWLYACGERSAIPYRQRIGEGSTVAVKMDDALNIRFVVNGIDCGVAHERVAPSFAESPPLHVCILFPARAHAQDMVHLLN